MNIAFIGLGLMGSRMAANLLKAGHRLVVHNRTKGKARPLLSSGARWADTPADAAREADVVITMLADPGAVAQMAEGPGGFLETLREGALWMDCSTVNPSFSRIEAEQARSIGARFLDAPVAGSTIPAERGELTFLVGGDPADVAACRPLFEAMGRRTVHAGGHGAGTGLKMLVNMLLAQSMAAFAEALVLGESMGLERSRLFDILTSTPAVAPFVSAKRQKIEQDAYEPQFPLKWMHKDLHLAGQTAYEQGVPVPLASAAEEVYALAVRHGLGDEDFAAVYRYLRGPGGEQTSEAGA